MTYTIWSYIDLLSNVGVDFYGFRGVAFRMAFTESKYAFERCHGQICISYSVLGRQYLDKQQGIFPMIYQGEYQGRYQIWSNVAEYVCRFWIQNASFVLSVPGDGFTAYGVKQSAGIMLPTKLDKLLSKSKVFWPSNILRLSSLSNSIIYFIVVRWRYMATKIWSALAQVMGYCLTAPTKADLSWMKYFGTQDIGW